MWFRAPRILLPLFFFSFDSSACSVLRMLEMADFYKFQVSAKFVVAIDELELPSITCCLVVRELVRNGRFLAPFYTSNSWLHEFHVVMRCFCKNKREVLDCKFLDPSARLCSIKIFQRALWFQSNCSRQLCYLSINLGLYRESYMVQGLLISVISSYDHLFNYLSNFLLCWLILMDYD